MNNFNKPTIHVRGSSAVCAPIESTSPAPAPRACATSNTASTTPIMGRRRSPPRLWPQGRPRPIQNLSGWWPSASIKRATTSITKWAVPATALTSRWSIPQHRDATCLALNATARFYHRAATARDRDKLRQFILGGIVWKLHRIWSNDWWHDANQEIDKLLGVLSLLGTNTKKPGAA